MAAAWVTHRKLWKRLEDKYTHVRDEKGNIITRFKEPREQYLMDPPVKVEKPKKKPTNLPSLKQLKEAKEILHSEDKPVNKRRARKKNV